MTSSCSTVGQAFWWLDGFQSRAQRALKMGTCRTVKSAINTEWSVDDERKISEYQALRHAPTCKLHHWWPWRRWKETQSRWNKVRMRLRENVKGKKGQTRNVNASPRHSWARCPVSLSQGIWLEILVLCLPPDRKMGHILFHAATAWHSFTAEHRMHYGACGPL